MLKEALIEQITQQQERPNLAEIRMLHTQAVDKEILGMLAAGSLHAVELDISSTEDGEHYEDGEYYIGHHRLFYENRGLVFPPPNVSIEEAMRVITKHEVFTELDCKDEKAIPKVAELAQRLGPSGCMLHAHIIEFDFELGFQNRGSRLPWGYEGISLDQLLELRDNTGYPAVQATCRGFTYNGIKTLQDGQVPRLREVCDSAKENKIDVVNLNLPDHQVPPDWALQYFFDNGVLLEVYEANIGGRQLPCNVFTTIEV